MSTENQELQLVQPSSNAITFGDSQSFEHAQRVAKMLSASNLVPKEYQNNVANTMIALEMANRTKSSPLMIMQNLYIVHGKPSWSGSFIIAALNGCGRFTPLRFDMQGQGATLSCMAYANDKKTGERINGTRVTMQMAEAEGWVNKPGSKWKTMPEQMIQYRAGTFFGRLYAPDILMGMPSSDEVEDFTVMASHEQIQAIESLLDTSTLPEEKRRAISWKIGNNPTQAEAFEIIGTLKANQLAVTDRPYMSATDAKKAVQAAIEKDFHN